MALTMTLDAKFAKQFGMVAFSTEDLRNVVCAVAGQSPDPDAVKDELRCPALEKLWNRRYRAQHRLKFCSVLKDVKETKICHCHEFYRLKGRRTLTFFCDFCANYEESEFARNDDPGMAGRF